MAMPWAKLEPPKRRDANTRLNPRSDAAQRWHQPTNCGLWTTSGTIPTKPRRNSWGRAPHTTQRTGVHLYFNWLRKYTHQCVHKLCAKDEKRAFCCFSHPRKHPRRAKKRRQRSSFLAKTRDEFQSNYSVAIPNGLCHRRRSPSGSTRGKKRELAIFSSLRV